ncbi:hypothetical protein C5748_15760 [Phyllobacterium phragmitis]|uniref:Uncharacterized protein n=1 Tax=Phyllobacterium phragmitis TaxID=2670329 RepID=A0A2S9IPU9_9HYPH|nr:hypothetical protein C5748_15760 [Phyllobacterium phragmitis]
MAAREIGIGREGIFTACRNLAHRLEAWIGFRKARCADNKLQRPLRVLMDAWRCKKTPVFDYRAPKINFTAGRYEKGWQREKYTGRGHVGTA